ncbi:hypothetical protein [Brevibacterium paucivorans]|uniref:Uncharacterized protein n=1 Tax=Brevibacterium paucivorans TaxID=170994 RepID=A0A2N6VLF5_9MICO|nr:hypothetical protein [Brevibacterium paucivorans]PMD04965.1 hypothetical protein CJ199_07655 [Brevibacterium paucivorans]
MQLPPRRLFSSNLVATIELETLSKLEQRSFVLGILCDDSDDFLSRNQSWDYSDFLKMPFKYLPSVDGPNETITLEVSLPPAGATLGFIIRTWPGNSEPVGVISEIAKISVKSEQYDQIEWAKLEAKDNN